MDNQDKNNPLNITVLTPSAGSASPSPESANETPVNNVTNEQALTNQNVAPIQTVTQEQNVSTVQVTEVSNSVPTGNENAMQIVQTEPANTAKIEPILKEFRVKKSNTLKMLLLFALGILLFIINYELLISFPIPILAFLADIALVVFWLVKIIMKNTTVGLENMCMYIPNSSYSIPQRIEGKNEVVGKNVRIVYSDITEVNYEEHTVYLKCKGFEDYIILKIEAIDDFINTLNNNLKANNLNINISNKNIMDTYRKYENKYITDKKQKLMILIGLVVVDVIILLLIDFFSFCVMLIVTLGLLYCLMSYKSYIFTMDDHFVARTELGDIKLTEDKILYSNVNKMVNTSGVIRIDTPKKEYKVRLNEYTDYFKNEMKSKGIKFL